MYMPSIFGESLFDNMFPFDEKVDIIISSPDCGASSVLSSFVLHVI